MSAENMSGGHCTLNNPFVVAFYADCHWNMSMSSNSTDNALSAYQMDSLFVTRMVLSCLNCFGIITSFIVYSLLVRSGSCVTFHTFLMFLSIFDFIHLLADFFTTYEKHQTLRTKLRSDNAKIISQIGSHSAMEFSDVHSMSQTFSFFNFMRLILYIAYPCRNYWVLFIVMLRCYVLRYKNSGSHNIAARHLNSSCQTLKGVRIPVILAFFLFLIFVVYVALWDGFANNSQVIYCDNSTLRISTIGNGGPIDLSISSVMAVNLAGPSCSQRTDIILQTLHFILTCGVPFVGVTIGSLLSLSVIQRSAFSERFRRARIMIYCTGFTFIFLEMPNFIAHMVQAYKRSHESEGERQPSYMGLFHELANLFTCLNSTVILILYIFMHNVMRKQMHAFFIECCTTTVVEENSPSLHSLRGFDDGKSTLVTEASCINFSAPNEDIEEYISSHHSRRSSLKPRYNGSAQIDSEYEDGIDVIAESQLPFLETSF